ncbi:DegQ family serine endoprotease [Thiomicrorhabdus aquaedulcis]|uniref:DegQ family serine endoprotease n=1 Tax=Thiomicrorhabdus aquaedulcis TaxID=2211106 RepID=UPI000FDAE865|nr:DegQ family serine endoprotease [Thiomicrorhabdus aquaedulcis]
MKKGSFFSSVMLSCLLVVQIPYASADNNSRYGLPDFTQLVEENNMVVVNISTTKKVERELPPQFKGMPDDMLRYFFGIPGLGAPQSPHGKSAPDKEEVHSLGSGFIISADGYIITNNHVIEGADEIVVRMRNRKELKATVVGTDKRTDVALLKINAKDLPVAKIGRSQGLKVGQWVVAIGEPFGLDYTVTQGIVSALGRALPEDTYVPFIQTDVAINPGNSGGPLFDLNGEVIGVNSQIYSKSGGSMGLSFAIPIDIAMNVVNQIKETGKVTRGFLGVQVQEVTSDLSESFGLTKPMGALVGETFPNTPAQKAGIESGDIILEFDGKIIEKSSDLPPIVGVTPVNKKVDVKLLRQGKEKTVSLTLVSLEQAEMSSDAQASQHISNRFGATVEDIDKNVLNDLKLPFGVMVSNVTGGPAEQAGLRKGDILVTIDFKPIKSAREFEAIVKTLPKGRSLPVRVVRNNQSLFLPLVFEK